MSQETKDGSEMTAAAAILGLVTSSSTNPPPVEEGESEHEEDEHLVIPQRFTKSGRKRAVPFPLKVSVIGYGKTSVKS